MHCKVFNVLCCPFPNPCLNTNPEFPSSVETISRTSSSGDITKVIAPMVIDADSAETKEIIPSKRVLYIYKNHGEHKKWIFGKPDVRKEIIGLKVK